MTLLHLTTSCLVDSHRMASLVASSREFAKIQTRHVRLSTAGQDDSTYRYKRRHGKLNLPTKRSSPK